MFQRSSSYGTSQGKNCNFMKTCEKLNKISQKDKVMRFLKELFAPVFQGTFYDVSLIHFFQIAEEFKTFFRKKNERT